MAFAPFLALALLLAACEGAPAGRPPQPAVAGYTLSGRVVDAADLLRPGEEARLSRTSEALERRTSDQLVIVTVPSLRGRTIEALGLELANGWGIGRADRDNGVLILVAPAERQVRIEVGYGLEPILTNERAGEIIRRAMLPHFREGRFREAIYAGADEIAATLTEQANRPRRGR